jgi:tRNA nucleotidyltransferase/poly(A) polymerase
MEKALAIQKQVIEVLGTDEVYLVGGSVRDIVLGKEAKDYDFTTPMLPDDVEAAIKNAGRRAYNIGNGKKHGTVGFKVEYEPKKFEYVEVTTFRSEVYLTKSRQPEVTFVTSLDEDLSRRDFTMNAMVLKPDGSIYDPYGGRIDILKRLINTVGLPKDRIQEDPLRILRAARFAARYGFNVDPNFIGKARQLAPRILDVSRERWVQELDKLLVGDFHSTGIQLLEDMGVLRYMIPELSFMLNQYKPLGNDYEQEHYNFDMEASHANPIFFPEDDVDTRWAIWLNKVSMPASRNYNKYGYINMENQVKISREINIGICARLKFSNERTKTILEYKKKS